MAKQSNGAGLGAIFFVRTLVGKPFSMRHTHHWVGNQGSKRVPGNFFKIKDVTIDEPTWTQLREDVVDVFYIYFSFFSAHGVFCNT